MIIKEDSSDRQAVITLRSDNHKVSEYAPPREDTSSPLPNTFHAVVAVELNKPLSITIQFKGSFLEMQCDLLIEEVLRNTLYSRSKTFDFRTRKLVFASAYKQINETDIVEGDIYVVTRPKPFCALLTPEPYGAAGAIEVAIYLGCNNKEPHLPSPPSSFVRFGKISESYGAGMLPSLITSLDRKTAQPPKNAVTKLLNCLSGGRPHHLWARCIFYYRSQSDIDSKALGDPKPDRGFVLPALHSGDPPQTAPLVIDSEDSDEALYLPLPPTPALSTSGASSSTPKPKVMAPKAKPAPSETTGQSTVEKPKSVPKIVPKEKPKLTSRATSLSTLPVEKTRSKSRGAYGMPLGEKQVSYPASSSGTWGPAGNQSSIGIQLDSRPESAVKTLIQPSSAPEFTNGKPAPARSAMTEDLLPSLTNSLKRVTGAEPSTNLKRPKTATLETSGSMTSSMSSLAEQLREVREGRLQAQLRLEEKKQRNEKRRLELQAAIDEERKLTAAIERELAEEDEVEAMLA